MNRINPITWAIAFAVIVICSAGAYRLTISCGESRVSMLDKIELVFGGECASENANLSDIQSSDKITFQVSECMQQEDDTVSGICISNKIYTGDESTVEKMDACANSNAELFYGDRPDLKSDLYWHICSDKGRLSCKCIGEKNNLAKRTRPSTRRN